MVWKKNTHPVLKVSNEQCKSPISRRVRMCAMTAMCVRSRRHTPLPFSASTTQHFVRMRQARIQSLPIRPNHAGNIPPSPVVQLGSCAGRVSIPDRISGEFIGLWTRSGRDLGIRLGEGRGGGVNRGGRGVGGLDVGWWGLGEWGRRETRCYAVVVIEYTISYQHDLIPDHHEGDASPLDKGG